jgi:bile acid:Na+ symporter, BASS family
MQRILSVVNHRDFVLSLALVTGLILGERTRPLAEISIYSLALVMIFATTGFSFKSWVPVRNAMAPLAWSAVLNYVVFSFSIIGLSWLFFRGAETYLYYIGFVLVAAAPPGPSIIPFAAMLRGDNNFSVTGVFGLHILALVLTPVILLVFLGQALINPMVILNIMVQLIVFPLIISRFLRHPRVLPKVNYIRETVIKWGFFLVIAPIVGMSAPVFFSQPISVLKISLVLFVTMFVMGFIYHVIMDRAGKPRGFIISSTLMMVIKSSAFAAVTAFTFFRGEAMVALPPAVVSVFVTLYIIFYSMFVRWFEKNKTG